MECVQTYSHIHGFNYTPSAAFNSIGFWRDYDERLIENELDMAERLRLNSARVFLSCVVFEQEPQAFLKRIKHFVRAAHARGISTMPALWDSCFTEDAPMYESTERRG